MKRLDVCVGGRKTDICSKKNLKGTRHTIISMLGWDIKAECISYKGLFTIPYFCTFGIAVYWFIRITPSHLQCAILNVSSQRY